MSQASAGALEGWLASGRLLATGNMPAFLSASQARGWAVRGAAVSPTSIDVRHAQPASSPSLLVLGNEGAGLSSDTLALCDELVQISPGQRSEGSTVAPGNAAFTLDSLNVSAAGAVLMAALRPHP